LIPRFENGRTGIYGIEGLAGFKNSNAQKRSAFLRMAGLGFMGLRDWQDLKIQTRKAFCVFENGRTGIYGIEGLAGFKNQTPKAFCVIGSGDLIAKSFR
jgi:hypothetical protein